MILLLSLLSPASACGGPDYAVLDAPLLPAERYLDDWLDAFDGYEVTPAPVTRFFYPLRPSDPAVYSALDAVLGDSEETPTYPVPSLDAFHAALRAGNRIAAHEAANAVVEGILDLPSALADTHAPLLRPAVEYLELEPVLGTLPATTVAAYFDTGLAADPVLARAVAVRGLAPSAAAPLLARSPSHPRAASLRWLVLRDTLAREIPNGWDRGEIAAAMGKGTPASIVAEADRWLRDFPGHPLADYVRLTKLRVHYLSGDADAAWAILFEMYPRHPTRVAAEMRFLLQQGLEPSGVEPEKLPPELAAALLPYAALTDETWSALWKKAEAAPDAPWSMPLRERLLWQLAVGELDGIPAAFPTAAGAPTETWARLRLVVLLRERRLDEAWAQSEVMDDREFLAPIRAQIRLLRGDWAGAIREPGLDPDSVEYLVRVLAPDAVLESMVDDPTLGADIRFNLALRRRVEGRGWKAGKLMAETDPGRADLWKQAKKLDRDRTRLAYARFMREAAGEIFLENTYEDMVWYRSLPRSGPGDGPERAPGLPFSSADEWNATSAWLRRSFATWAAFGAYSAWLDSLDVQKLDADGYKEAMIALDEADRSYNALLNYGSWDSYAWGSIVVESPEAVTVRRVGKELRK